MYKEKTYRSWQDFEISERRRVGSFQLSVDDLAKDLYIENPRINENIEDSEEISELNFG